MIYIFSDYILNTPHYELFRNGHSVGMRRKTLDILIYLIQNRHRVVSQDELLDSIWPETAVGNNVVINCIKEIRDAIGDDGRNQKIIKTLHRRGYRFIADVTEQAEELPKLNAPVVRSYSTTTLRAEVLTAGTNFVDALERYTLCEGTPDKVLSYELHVLLLRIEQLMSNLLTIDNNMAQESEFVH
jgi:DNA-binding winged helix-turn-helix (wHTH) protein